MFLDAKSFSKAVEDAVSLLVKNVRTINALNVFPVPDGDTGVNMLDTMRSGLEQVQGLKNGTLKDTASALARGSLMGARGNSGVILAQYLVGFSSVIDSQPQLNCPELSAALKAGTESAYAGVADPQEGTLLTVMRRISSEALSLDGSDAREGVRRVVAVGVEALKSTKEILPQLREAGVVDAGGLGFLYIAKAFADVLHEAPIELHLQDILVEELERMETSREQLQVHSATRYCLEFLLGNSGLEPEQVLSRFSEAAESVEMVAGEGIVHLHIHTNDPDGLLGVGASLGEVTQVKIDDMFKQIDRFILGELPADSNEVGCISFANGEGLAEIMRSLGASDILVTERMNPSVEMILGAIDRLPQDRIVVLPNNRNAVPAAKTASGLSNKSITVIETSSIAQGLTALVAGSSCGFDPTGMERAAARTTSGEVTRAVRAAMVEQKSIKNGDYLGFLNGRLVTVGQEREQVALELIKELSRHGELLTIYFGKTVKSSEAGCFRKGVEKAFPELEIELYYGGQAFHDYLISVE